MAIIYLAGEGESVRGGTLLWAGQATLFANISIDIKHRQLIYTLEAYDALTFIYL